MGSQRTELATYLCPPSTGLPDCRRPASGPFRLALDLRDGLAPPGFCVEELTALPDAPLAAGTELTVEAIEGGRQGQACVVELRTTQPDDGRNEATAHRLDNGTRGVSRKRGTREKPRGLNGRAEGGRGEGR